MIRGNFGFRLSDGLKVSTVSGLFSVPGIKILALLFETNVTCTSLFSESMLDVSPMETSSGQTA